jgi:hypothetical protein
MNQENYNEEEIRDLSRDLGEVGLSPNLRVSFYFGVNPNEFLYTNVQKFTEHYWGKNSFSPETKVQYKDNLDPTTTEKRNILIVYGPSHDVRKIQEDFPTFPWVDPNSIESISEEWD